MRLSAPSPLTKVRAYEAFLRPPAALWSGAWGTVDAYRYRIEHTDSIAAWPSPTDAQTQDFGVVDTSVSTVSIAEPDEGKLIVAPDNFAVIFDGADDFVSIPPIAALNNLATFTVEAWVNHDATGTASAGIFEKSVGGAVNTQFLLFLEGGLVKWRVKPAAAATQTVTLAWAPYENAFHHVAGTYDGQVMRLYVDGVLGASFDFGVATAVATGAGGCAIGSSSRRPSSGRA
jgi:hypothetical protein